MVVHVEFVDGAAIQVLRALQICSLSVAIIVCSSQACPRNTKGAVYSLLKDRSIICRQPVAIPKKSH